MATTVTLGVLGLVAVAVVVTAISRRRQALAERWHFRLRVDMGRDRTVQPPDEPTDDKE